MPLLRGKTDQGILTMLENVGLFSTLSNRQLWGLARAAKDQSFAEGATIVKQGDTGIALFMIVDGRVEVRRKGRKLATLGPGKFFGEMALFEAQSRTADVVAVRPTRCLVLSRWEFWGFAEGQPKMLRSMLEEMARRLAATDMALAE